MVEYKYDAWGNHEIEIESETYEDLATKNPFRYRGYYYDQDTRLYYLKSRYYDPVVGRFITIDDISYIDPETINGLNLYAYCGNNPVMHIDANGNAWWDWVLGVVIIVGALALSIATGGLATPIATALGSGLFGAIIGGAVAGAIGGAIAGFGISLGMQGILNGFNNIDWKEVGDATLSGAISGAIAGGVFGAIKHFASAAKIANKLSGLNTAQANLDKATLALKNTDSFIGVVKGGSMATRTIAQASYDAASILFNQIQTANAVYKLGVDIIYAAAKFAFKQLVAYGMKGWF